MSAKEPAMSDTGSAQEKAAATYNAAADAFDHPVNVFWDRYGRRTVERLHLSPGSRVLDACCGSGASAIPAAEIVGPTGFVLGVDLAEKLLELARYKAASSKLSNVDFQKGDVLDLKLPESTFDTIVCVFGIFFVPDMQAAIRALWRVLRPGGKLAITTWGPRFLEPASTAFWDAIRAVRPDLYKGFNPWDRISEPSALYELMRSAGVKVLDVVAETGSCAVKTPDDWWHMVEGTGYRGTVEQLSADEVNQVRSENIEFIRREKIRDVESNVLYAVGVKV
jgi:ubiquinone/menaquinone biosynthesis C-methylase UbiE